MTSNKTKMTAGTSNKAITAAINKAASSQTAFQKDIQSAITLIVAHAAAFNDCSAFGRLLNRLNRNVAKVALITRFVAEHTTIKVGPDAKNKGKVKSFFQKDADGKAIPTTEEMASRIKALEWWKHEPEAPIETIFTIEDANEKVGNVISFLKRVLEGKAKSTKVADGDKAALRQKIEALEAIEKPEAVGIAA